MKEIGEKIKEARLEKGIEIKKVAEDTKIRRKYLLAIEEGNFGVLPQEVFLKGFLRVYANYVGLDGDELLSKYNRLKTLEQKQSKLKASEETKEFNPFLEELISLLKNNWTTILLRIGVLILIFFLVLGIYHSGILVKVVKKIRGLEGIEQESIMILGEHFGPFGRQGEIIEKEFVIND